MSFDKIKAAILEVVKNIDEFSLDGAVGTIGIFDGVHSAHQQLIVNVKKNAEKYKKPSVLVTMWPHPRKVLFPDSELQLLTSLDEKISIVESFGIDYLIVLPFDVNFAQTSYHDFIYNYFVEKLKIRYLIIGYNHHFGKNREGNFENLKLLSVKYNFIAERLSPVFIKDEKISSSKVRKLLLEGDIKQASQMLGYNFFIKGKVIKGKQLGQTIGFPTANIKVIEPDKLIPRIGVYAVKISIDNETYDGMLNIGYRPTVANDNNVSIEVNIFNFNKDIYTKDIKIEFIDKLRDELKFANIDELKSQLIVDKQNTIKIIREFNTKE